MNFETCLRKLARTVFWQRLYQSSQEQNIYLFNNNTNLSGLQILFLYWLDIYHTLYQELHEKKWEILDEEVLNDDIRTDAFIYWRRKQQEKDILKYQQNERQYKNKTNKAKPGLKHYPIFKGSEQE